VHAEASATRPSEGEGRYLRQTPYDRVAADPEVAAALVRQAVVRQTDMLA
jgi:hypothetical protein